MTPLTEGMVIALSSLRANKARAALTILGVAIGVMVVMVMAALISGINRSVSNIFQSIAPRTFIVFRHFQAGITVSGGDETPAWMHNPPLTDLEAERLARLHGVRFLSRREDTQAPVAFGDQRLESVFIVGVNASWVEVDGGDVFRGRSFTRIEDLANTPVAVINTKLASQLFPGRDPLGQTIHIAGVPFEVIGLYAPPPSFFNSAAPPVAIVPHGAFVKHVPYVRGWMRFAVVPDTNVAQQDVMDEVTAALRSQRGLRPGQPDTFSLVTQDKLLDIWNQITGVFFLVMLVLSSIGLLVGGVGVVAIMMISVTERTREIGVRKALGATRREILWQFLVEASTLTLVGGAIGMAVGGIAAFAVSALTPIPAYVPLWAIFAALLVSALTGVGFGLYPASRAARLDPVEALRYE